MEMDEYSDEPPIGNEILDFDDEPPIGNGRGELADYPDEDQESPYQENDNLSGTSTLSHDETLSHEELVRIVNRSVQQGDIDVEKTKELLKLAKGMRTIAAFAADMGITTNNLSRIMCGKIIVLRKDTMIKIVENAAPGSGVTIQALMDAQGYLPWDDAAIGKEGHFVGKCREAIAKVLKDKGFEATYQKQGPGRPEVQPLYNIDITSTALSKGGGRWLIECKKLTNFTWGARGSEKIQHWLDAAMAYYYRGDIAGRISVLVDQQDVFDRIKEKLSSFRLRDEISVILMSEKHWKIIDEYVAPLMDGQEAVLPFSEPCTSSAFSTETASTSNPSL